ncbi:potassium channel family protein [Constantimarinum furrinae]|uniref:Voltage-gated potassium channel n=1 Tax=Constantimarinum furrinae TaxID=2562285 RepID=A0A7G8PV86_9FLAO|nr:potassium channel protein [Constantimarinum furrinae]QNJ98252.1 voltage-gated potassium channel [Constantimarinum furrinae]
MIKLLRSNIVGALLLLVLVFLIGVIGFRFFSGYSWVDAWYMTVISITTVGFKEVEPLSNTEKVFTSVLILTSIFIVGYAIKVITEYILSSNNIGNLKQKKVQKKIDSLSGQVIVCGYGRNGRQAVEKLMAYNKSFVVIEDNKDVVERFTTEDMLFVHGNAVEDEILIRAGIEKASVLICALPSDADNLFVVLSARQINKDLKIISRATEEASYKKLKLAGADNVILPDRIGGEHMASLVVVPDLVEFLDNLSVTGEKESINVKQVDFEKICKDGREQSIRELDIRKKTGCSVIGYKTPEGEYIVNPEPSMIIKKQSKLILIGRPDQIESLKTYFKD